MTLNWVGGEVAETWAAGSIVLIRVVRPRRMAEYEADNWHRPDWVAGLVRGHSRQNATIEWAMLEAASE